MQKLIVISLFVIAGLIVMVVTVPSTPVKAQATVMILQGEPGAPVCGTDPCDGVTCVLQGEPTVDPGCTCP